jgi:hypothetical protein
LIFTKICESLFANFAFFAEHQGAELHFSPLVDLVGRHLLPKNKNLSLEIAVLST